MRHDFDEEAPWWRRPRNLTTTAVVLTLASWAVLFAVQPWDSTTPADEATPVPNFGESVTVSSRCGLPDGAQKVPTMAPVETWQMVGWAATPLNPHTFGPAEQADGIYTCFARSPFGAVMAAVLDAAQRGSSEVDATRYVEARYAKGEYYDQGMRDLVEAEVPTDQPVAGEVAGFRVFHYSRDTASVEVALRYAEAPLAGQLIAAFYEMEWANGDWQLRMPESFRSTARPLDTLRGYTAWTTPPRGTIRGTDRPAGQATGAFRPAPAWAGAQAQSRVVGTTGVQRLALASATTDNAGMTLAAPAAAPKTADCSGFGLLKCGLDIATTPGVPSTLIRQVPGAAVSAAASGAASTVMGEIADEVVAAQEWTLEVLLTAWLRSPDPDVTGADSATVWLEGHLAVLVVFATLGAVLLSTYRMATTGKLEHLSEIGMLLTRVILTGGLVGVVVTLGLEIGDMWSGWVLDQVEYDLSGLLTWDNALPAMILVLLGLFMIVVQFFQFVVMMFRYGAVLYLCAVVTLLAATSSTRSGKQSWEKALAWLLAFVLYKPVAATIYAGTIFMTSPDQEIADRIVGVAMTVLALVALPALMRLIVPQTAALGAGNAGALAGATVGAAVATGAVLATGGAAAGAGLSAGAASSSAPVARGAGTVTGGGGGGGGGGDDSSGGATGAQPQGGNPSMPGGPGPSTTGGPVTAGATGGPTSTDPGEPTNAAPHGAAASSDGGSSSSPETGLSSTLGEGQEAASRFGEGAVTDEANPGGASHAGVDVAGGSGNGSSRAAGDLWGGVGRGVGAGGRFTEEAGAAVDGAETTNEGQDS